MGIQTEDSSPGRGHHHQKTGSVIKMDREVQAEPLGICCEVQVERYRFEAVRFVQTESKVVQSAASQAQIETSNDETQTAAAATGEERNQSLTSSILERPKREKDPNEIFFHMVLSQFVYREKLQPRKIA